MEQLTGPDAVAIKVDGSAVGISDGGAINGSWMAAFKQSPYLICMQYVHIFK